MRLASLFLQIVVDFSKFWPRKSGSASERCWRTLYQPGAVQIGKGDQQFKIYIEKNET